MWGYILGAHLNSSESILDDLKIYFDPLVGAAVSVFLNKGLVL